jgi:hypothetical protein
MTRCEAIDVVAAALQSGAPRHFQIALVGYLLDGWPYPADGLAVNTANTPNFVRTPDGFTCDGFFPPTILDAPTVSSRGFIRSASGVEMVRVRIEVEFRNVWAVAEFIDGRQRDLFIDPGVMIARKFAFAKEAADWRDAHSTPPRMNASGRR